MRRKAEIMVLPFSFPAFKFSPRRRVFTFFFKAESDRVGVVQQQQHVSERQQTVISA